MRIDFDVQFAEIINEVKEYIKKMPGIININKKVKLNKKIYKLSDVASIICKVEAVSCFISSSTNANEISIKQVLQLFRLTSNSYIPYFNNTEKSTLAKLQSTLYKWAYKSTVEAEFEQYSSLPKEWKIMEVNKKNGHVFSVSFRKDGYSLTRFSRYLKELEKQLPHVLHDNAFTCIDESEFFNHNEVLYFNEFENVEKSITIDSSLLNYSKRNSKIIILNTQPTEAKPVSICTDDLLSWAKGIDLKDSINKKQKKNWEERIKDIIISVPEPLGLVTKSKIQVNGILNMVGALSVGKSTFMTVCSYGLAKRGNRVAIFLNTVPEVLKTVDYLSELGTKAVPLLSQHQIHKHAIQYLSTLKSNNELFESRKSLEYTNDCCILLNATANILNNYDESVPPCNSLYIIKEKNNGNKENKNISCPLVGICPRFNSIRDLNNAEVIVTTASSAVKSYLPKPYAVEQMTILEYIIRTCDLVFIDEADQVQNNLDNMFCNTISIYGDKSIFYKATKNRLLEYQETGEVPDNIHVLDFIKGTSNVEMYTANVINFLTNTEDIDDLFSRDIFDKLIKSQLLWKDLFNQAVGINAKVLRNNEGDEEFYDQLSKARKAFGNSFDKFQRNLSRGELPNPDDKVTYSLRIIASNLTDETKLIVDLEILSNLKLCQLLKFDNMEDFNKENFIKIPKLYENWDEPLASIVNRLVEKLRFIMDLYMLEYKLKSVLDKWELVRILDKRIVDSKYRFPGSMKKEFSGIVPSIPIDMSFGFIITKADDGKIQMKYINLEGIGRWILLNFDRLYYDIDGARTNCILLSGTSNIEKSPKYNIELPIGCLLHKRNAKKPRLNMFFPTPVVSTISGTKYTEVENSLNILADNLFNARIDTANKGYLRNVLERLPEGRKRVLFALGSYKDCSTFSNRLNKYMDGSYSLVRTGEAKGNDFNEIERGKIEDIAKYNIKALSIPLQIGRGYNIITEVSEVVDLIDETNVDTPKKSVAAIGATFFVKRPYYVPNDVYTMVSWVNCAYIKMIERYRKREYSEFDLFYSSLIGKLYKVLSEFDNIFGYQSLSKLNRDKLLGDTLVDVFQLACRIIRGDVDAEIHFIDSSFAPNTASANVNYDSERTSMIIGWRNMVKNMIESPDDLAKGEINKELYYMLLRGLEMIHLNEQGGKYSGKEIRE